MYSYFLVKFSVMDSLNKCCLKNIPCCTGDVLYAKLVLGILGKVKFPNIPARKL